MKRTLLLSIAVLAFTANLVWADTFASGTANQFTIDFVPISGDASSANGTNIGYQKTFVDPGYSFRVGTYEITNSQWANFRNIYGTPTGNPSSAYDSSATYADTYVPTNNVSWYEAAQFVNYLNTSTGHTAAYKFTGTKGTSDYTFTVWDVTDVGYDASNPYRNSNSFYFLPTENEWVKAAYWNGTNLQNYATRAGETLFQGNGSNRGWNYYTTQFAMNPWGPWKVGSGSEELNGTYDMMGNVFEWLEGPYPSGNYTPNSRRGVRGGGYSTTATGLSLTIPWNSDSIEEQGHMGFRVASIPEPCTLLLLGLGGLALRLKRSR